MKIDENDIAVIKSLIDDYGNDCPYTDWNLIQALGEKLGILNPVLPPTEEELKRREEFANSSYGKAMSELFKRTNEHMIKMLLEEKQMKTFFDRKQWPVGTTLKIKLPDGTDKILKRS